MVVNENEHHWITQNHPGLQVFKYHTGKRFEGKFEFFAAFDERTRLYHVNPEQLLCKQLICIRDLYSIRILLSSDQTKLPQVYETGGRLSSVANRLGLPLSDLHVNASGEACMWGPFDPPQIESFQQFIQGPVTQFFYDQSYFERYGRWPRGVYSHGVIGAIESYFENISADDLNGAQACVEYITRYRNSNEGREVLSRLVKSGNIQGHLPCVCGSDKPFRSCHENAFRGLWRLNQLLREQRIRLGA